MLASHTLGTATYLTLSPANTFTVSDTLGSSTMDFFQIDLVNEGLLTVQLDPTGVSTLHGLLGLYGPDQALMIQSNGQVANPVEPLISQHLIPGTYYLGVSAPTAAGAAASGAYALSGNFVYFATPPYSPVGLNSSPGVVLGGDFNGDGIPDVFTAETNPFLGPPPTSLLTGVRFGIGDGTFQQLAQSSLPPGYYAMVAGRFDADNLDDLAVLYPNAAEIQIFLSNGDGTFRPGGTSPMSGSPNQLTTGDFNGDGKLDLATYNAGTSDVSILLGNGDGTFRNEIHVPFSLPAPPAFFNAFQIASADINGDGKDDLALLGATNFPPVGAGLPPAAAYSVTVLSGFQSTNFQTVHSFTPPGIPSAMVLGDFNGDHHADLALNDPANQRIIVSLSDGQGGFLAPNIYASGNLGDQLLAADVTGDGRLDLIVTKHFNGTGQGAATPLTTLAGDGQGGFTVAATQTLKSTADAVLALDLDRDGRTDLVVNFPFPGSVLPGLNGSLELNTLRSLGDGTFQDQPVSPAGGNVQVADFNNDHNPDLALDTGIFLGHGDGTYAPAVPFPGGGQVEAVGDFNLDGRTDLITFQSQVIFTPGQQTLALQMLLGLGDGTFQVGRPVPITTFAPMGPQTAQVVSVSSGDFDHDGTPDLFVVTLIYQNIGLTPPLIQGWFLHGLGDGTFQETYHLTLNVTNLPAVAVGDFNHDGILDLALGGQGTSGGSPAGQVLVMLGTGNGGFTTQTLTIPQANSALAITVADLDGDGAPDLAVSCQAVTGQSDFVLILQNQGHGTGSFQPLGPLYPVGSYPVAIVAADFNHDGNIDLATANPGLTTGDPNLSVLLGTGGGAFGTANPLPTPTGPHALVAADLNRDGVPDLTSVNTQSADLSVYLGLGDGTFLAQKSIFPKLQRATPLLADINGDGFLDAVVLRNEGTILYRQGLANQPGQFSSPVVVNMTDPNAPSRDPSARDVALVATTGGRTLVAALDFANSTVSFYALQTNGSFLRVSSLALSGSLPVRLTAGDLNGDGLDDLVVTLGGSNQVLVVMQDTTGGFSSTSQTYLLDTGASPDSVTIADVDGRSGKDIVVADQSSGDVSVFLNDPVQPFAAGYRFRSDTGPYGALFSLDQPQSRPSYTLADPETVVVGNFDGVGAPDLIVGNRGTHAFTLLQGTGGGFLNPTLASTFVAGPLSQIVAADLNGDGFLDLAVLDPESSQITIYLGDGAGGFRKVFIAAAGNGPTGFSIRDVNRDGFLDLVVGNQFGDVLVLLGNGDGTFQSYRRTERGIPLAVADIDGNGQDDFILANRSADVVTVALNSPDPTAVLANNTDPQPVLGPGAVKLVDLNGDGIKDLIVANSGSNNVLVYLGNPDHTFQAARTFFVGTNPTSVTVGDVNLDGIPDLVITDTGSNDVAVLKGQGTGASWTLTYGPRLSSNGVGPSSAQIVQLPGHANPDIVVSNGVSGNVALLPGTGQGFFNDQGAVSAGSALPSPTTPIVFTNLPHAGAVATVNTPFGGGFVVLDSGGHDLTEFAGFTGNNFQTVLTVDVGGFNPVALITADFNGDGFTDLVVANANTDSLGSTGVPGEGTGNLTLLLGGDGGFVEDETFTDPEMPHPSAVALSALNGESVFYATTEGLEHAFRFELPTQSVPTSTPPPDTLLTKDVPGESIALPFGAPSEALAANLPPSDLLLLGDAGLHSADGGSSLAASTLVHEPSTLGSLDLLAFADGGKGDSSDAFRRLLEGWAEANSTWIASVQEGASAGEAVAAGVIADARDAAASLTGPVLQFVGMDGLKVPDLQWRVIGGQVVDVAVGSLRTTWNGTALAEMGDRFQTAFRDVFSPWLPAETVTPAPESVPAFEGSREAIHGLTEVMRSAAPLAADAPWRQTVEDVSRSLWRATDACPARSQPPERSVPRPLYFASTPDEGPPTLPTLVDRPLELSTHPDNRLMIEERAGREREAFWLALSLGTALPLQRPLGFSGGPVPEDQKRPRIGGSK